MAGAMDLHCACVCVRVHAYACVCVWAFLSAQFNVLHRTLCCINSLNRVVTTLRRAIAKDPVTGHGLQELSRKSGSWRSTL